MIYQYFKIIVIIRSNKAWPRDGIVRIDITRGNQGALQDMKEYSLHHSYAKEQRIHQREQYEYQSMFGLISTTHR